MKRVCWALVFTAALFGLSAGCSRHQDDIPVHQGDNPFATPESHDSGAGGPATPPAGDAVK